jgi:hypothetical protein
MLKYTKQKSQKAKVILVWLKITLATSKKMADVNDIKKRYTM